MNGSQRDGAGRGGHSRTETAMSPAEEMSRELTPATMRIVDAYGDWDEVAERHAEYEAWSQRAFENAEARMRTGSERRP